VATYESAVTGVAAGTANEAICSVWVTGSKQIRLREIGYINVGSTNAEKVALVRISARGTQASTQAGTPLDINDAASAATMDGSWSVQPTVSGNYLRRTAGIINSGSAVIFSFWGQKRGIWIAAGAGVALVNPVAVASDASECWAVWQE
jgi:hypothetical protein